MVFFYKSLIVALLHQVLLRNVGTLNMRDVFYIQILIFAQLNLYSGARIHFGYLVDGSNVLEFYGGVNETFGSAVSISGNGTTFVVTSIGGTTEYVRVYKNVDAGINNFTQFGPDIT